MDVKQSQNNARRKISKVGKSFASQGYGRSLDIEAGRISLASGGGEGGFGVRVLQDGRYGYAHLVDPSGAEHAVSGMLNCERQPENRWFYFTTFNQSNTR